MKVPKTAVWGALFAAILVLVASVAGLVLKATYARETPSYALQGTGQDVENLFAALTLLVTSYLVRRWSLEAYLVWLGSLLALMYSYATYAFAVHFNALFLRVFQRLTVLGRLGAWKQQSSGRVCAPPSHACPTCAHAMGGAIPCRRC